MTMVDDADTVHHPIFARVYERISASADRRGADRHRAERLAGLTGRVLEVGAGNGRNFGHYPSGVTEVLAVEPERRLRETALRAAAQAEVPVRVVDGVADRLPADDATVDAGIASLVLCTVPDQDAALAELRRVIRPGGELRFYEHVVSRRPGAARLERALDATIYPHLSGGCHPRATRSPRSSAPGSRSRPPGGSHSGERARPPGRPRPRHRAQTMIGIAVADLDGTVTLLFSDIENSTRLTERLGDDRWLELLAAHNTIVRTQVDEHGGYEVKS